MSILSVMWTASNSVPHRTKIEPIGASTEVEKQTNVVNMSDVFLGGMATVITHQVSVVTYIG